MPSNRSTSVKSSDPDDRASESPQRRMLYVDIGVRQYVQCAFILQLGFRVGVVWAGQKKSTVQRGIIQ